MKIAVKTSRPFGERIKERGTLLLCYVHPSPFQGEETEGNYCERLSTDYDCAANTVGLY